MDKLPPKWLGAIDMWLKKNHILIWIALFFLFFFVWPLFQDSGPLDPQLLQGIDE